MTDRSVYASVPFVTSAEGNRGSGVSGVEGAADAVVVGGGTLGGWCAWFLKNAGLNRVVLVEAETLGYGASSRAAGIVRAQGGTETAVRLGMWSQRFYAQQRETLGIDSGFVASGYLMPCFRPDEVAAAHARIAMQQALGLDARWLEPDRVDALSPNLAPGRTLGASYAPGDGYVDPPRNVLAYAVALFGVGVEVHERTMFTRLRTDAGHVTAVETSRGTVEARRVVLTGGPQLAAVGQAAGVRVPTGGARHQVVVTEPHSDLSPDRVPMVFDLASGIYWRPCEGGLLWGMSNPDEKPGVAATFDEAYFAAMRARVADLLPVTAGLGIRKSWAATIDFTPDHLPILGPLLGPDGPLGGTTVASAGGHGMMWGPGVARAAADLALTGTTDVVDTRDLGLDRFDAEGRSRLAADPIALPFPESA